MSEFPPMSSLRSRACETIAEALGGTLLVRTGDLDLDELRRTGVLPEKAAYSVDVTDFYTRVSTDGNGKLKNPGGGHGTEEHPWGELVEFYEEKGIAPNQKMPTIDRAEWNRQKLQDQILSTFRRAQLPPDTTPWDRENKDLRDRFMGGSDADRLQVIAETLGLEVMVPTSELPAPYIRDQARDLAKNITREVSLRAGVLKEKAQKKWTEARRSG